MRIKSATLRNYRMHRELMVTFDPSRTLIGGPNEVGKSTLVEALHRALFLKAKGNTENHRAMQSALHAGHPEVEVVFETGGHEYQLKKRFGTSGSTTLSSSIAAASAGDEAEEVLARLLSVESVASGKAMLSQWAHLWVWQGQAGDDPSTHATAQHSALMQRLQGAGVAVALQSSLDARIAGSFADAVSGIYTQGGKAKANSELERAESAASQAEEALSHANERLQKLESAVSEVEAATREIPKVQESLAGLQKERETLEDRASKLNRLRQQEAWQTTAAGSAGESHERLKTADGKICDIRSAILQLEKDIEPKQNHLTELEQTREAARLAADQAEKDYRAKAETIRSARLRRDLAAAWRRSFETEEQRARLLEKQERVTKLRQELAEAQIELAKVPNVDRKKLNKLQDLESTSTAARTALQAMAAGLEVLASGQPIRVGEQTLAKGQKLILTEDTELHIGDTTRLRITPGGGRTLAEARQAEADAGRALQQQLDSLGLKSFQEATDAMARREEINGKIKTTKAGLDGLAAETLDTELSKAQTDWTAAAADVARLKSELADAVDPLDRAKAEELEKERRDSLSAAEDAESDAKALRDKTADSFSQSDAALTQGRAAIDGERKMLNDLKAQIQLLLQTHGDDSVRAQALSAARTANEEAATALKETQSAIAALQPDLLDGDRKRVERAISEKTKEREDLRTQLAEARASLRLDGIEDPRSAHTSAEVRARFAREYQHSVRRKSEAIALLDRMFKDEQRALAEQFTQPLADKISGYLQCIFGPAARARVTLENSQFTGLCIFRPGSGGGTFAFETLSGGAREQAAAAVRLAMAEVLAADHGGCLPVVFDDAFAYSDPERVNQLQRMLDLAATRGLQIIVLTCNPADYATLGAHQIVLRVEQAASVRPQALAGPDTVPVGDEPLIAEDARQPAAVIFSDNAPAIDEEGLRAAFLGRLREFGGNSGNMKLRNSLGWSDESYNRVKDQLVADGTVVPGRGKGGSVALASQP